MTDLLEKKNERSQDRILVNFFMSYTVLAVFAHASYVYEYVIYTRCIARLLLLLIRR